MNNLVLIGATRQLVCKLEKFDFNIIRMGRHEALNINFENCFSEKFSDNVPMDERRYCINVGKLIGKHILEASENEVFASLKVNLIGSILLIEKILKENPNARIVIIGSESGKKGSYDTVYFLAKAALRRFVKERRVLMGQQLVMISPSTIGDSNMTISRADQERLEVYRNNHPKQRFVYMEEIAATIKFVLADEAMYISNTEIEINGGKFARMHPV